MTTKTKSPKVAAQTSRSAIGAAGKKPKPATTESAASARLRKEARAAVAANLARLEVGEGGGAPVNDHNEQGGQQPAEQPPDVGDNKPSAGGGKSIEPEQKPVGPKGQRGAKHTPGSGTKPAKAVKPVTPVTPVTPVKPKRLSCIDAAAQIIGKDPIGCKDLIAEMGVRKLWTSPSGKTPDASLYAAIIREISAKGAQARFRKVDRGLFVANPGSAGR